MAGNQNAMIDPTDQAGAPLPGWKLRARTLLPIVQGGMGVGISAHRLAGSVAALGAVGTISSVDLRHHHADLLARSVNCRDRNELDRLNRIALDREIRMALELAGGRGAIAVNVMKAVADHAACVRQSCESGAHAIVMGAGLPARAVLTPWLKNYLRREKALQSHAKADPARCVPRLNCLTLCGLRDGIANIGQFCIDTRLAFALNGDVKKGLFFRGSERLPFGSEIHPVSALIDYLMSGRIPAVTPAMAAAGA